MSWLSVIGSAITLLLLILKEVFSDAARRRQEDEKFQIDQKAFLEAAQRAIETMRTRARAESQQAQDVEDQVDSERNRK